MNRKICKNKEMEDKNYYDSLNEKIAKEKYENYPSYPSGRNGFSETERRIGYIICSLFLIIVALIYIGNGVRWTTRDRKLTMENFEECLLVNYSLTPTRAYEISLTTKKGAYTIYDLSVTMEVEFKEMFGGESFTYRVIFNAPELSAGNSVTRTVYAGENLASASRYYYDGYEIIAVSGRM